MAGRDVSADTRLELRQMTPNPQRGLNYSDLAQIALERARTAREAAQIVCSLVKEHGYATFGGNSHIFANTTEGWIMLEFAGVRASGSPSVWVRTISVSSGEDTLVRFPSNIKPIRTTWGPRT